MTMTWTIVAVVLGVWLAELIPWLAACVFVALVDAC